MISNVWGSKPFVLLDFPKQMPRTKIPRSLHTTLASSVKTYILYYFFHLSHISLAYTAMSKSCYFPDGTLSIFQGSPLTVMVPCDPNAATSACCGQTDACFADGLCMNSALVFYRGACTDKTFSSSDCFRECLSAPSMSYPLSYPFPITIPD